LLIVLIIFSLPLSADFSGLVIKVIDGDTIIVLDGAKKRKVRLVGIDAPELKQNFGLKSKQELSDLIDRKRVKILSNSEDRFKRALGKVIYKNIDINLSLIKVGMAWHYKRYKKNQSKKDQVEYAYHEKLAIESQIGLWGDNNSIAPWDWRRGKR
tara:strand:+ start:115 stop:579 length:465 start_codon:yes stop_codon:yes gene_type:complete